MSPSTHFPTESDGGGQKNVKNPLTKDTEYGIIIIEREQYLFTTIQQGSYRVKRKVSHTSFLVSLIQHKKVAIE